jgi:transcriptional regulator with XRE-family HTH domain
MYDKDQVRERFLEEAERLINSGVAKSYSKLADGCGLQAYHFSDIRTGRSEVTLLALTSFVQAYRPYGVSYGYILDGQREKPVVPHEALDKIERAKQRLEEAHKLLTNN